MYLSYTGDCPPVSGTEMARSLGPCQIDAMNGELQTILGEERVLECEKDGSYKVHQCPDNAGSGSDCYCVDGATGEGVGPPKANGLCDLRPCEIHNERVEGKIDPEHPEMIPGCDDFEIIHGMCHKMECDGKMFKQKQCNDNACFCVDINTGQRIPGTNVLPSRGASLDCN